MLQLRLASLARTQSAASSLQRRTLWRCSTLISSSPSSLLAHVEAQHARADERPALFALSKNTPQELVQRFQTALLPPPPALTPSPIGCISEVVPRAALPDGVQAALPSETSEPFSLSLAYHVPSSPSARLIPFRSTLTGRPPIALGREIRPELQHDAEDDPGFEAFLRGEKWGFGQAKVDEGSKGEDIEELRGVDSSHVREVVALTADRIEPFLGALSSFPTAAKGGLVGSSTPFHSATHLPFTLFFGRNTFSTGAVGLAVVEPNYTQPTAAKLSYGSLKAMGKPFEVTSSQGNIVLTLSSQNAARLLLEAVNELFGTSAQNLSAVQRSEEKEKDFYAAVFDHQPSLPLDLSQARLVSKIMAGAPSRGAMSIDTEEEIKEGDYLAFVHVPPASTSAPASVPPPAASLKFVSIPPSDSLPLFRAADAPSSGLVIELDSFLAVSENGVLATPALENAAVRVCKIEGASVRLQ